MPGTLSPIPGADASNNNSRGSRGTTRRLRRRRRNPNLSAAGQGRPKEAPRRRRCPPVGRPATAARPTPGNAPVKGGQHKKLPPFSKSVLPDGGGHRRPQAGNRPTLEVAPSRYSCLKLAAHRVRNVLRTRRTPPFAGVYPGENRRAGPPLVACFAAHIAPARPALDTITHHTNTSQTRLHDQQHTPQQRRRRKPNLGVAGRDDPKSRPTLEVAPTRCSCLETTAHRTRKVLRTKGTTRRKRGWSRRGRIKERLEPLGRKARLEPPGTNQRAAGAAHGDDPKNHGPAGVSLPSALPRQQPLPLPITILTNSNQCNPITVTSQMPANLQHKRRHN